VAHPPLSGSRRCARRYLEQDVAAAHRPRRLFEQDVAAALPPLSASRPRPRRHFEQDVSEQDVAVALPPLGWSRAHRYLARDAADAAPPAHGSSRRQADHYPERDAAGAAPIHQLACCDSVHRILALSPSLLSITVLDTSTGAVYNRDTCKTSSMFSKGHRTNAASVSERWYAPGLAPPQR